MKLKLNDIYIFLSYFAICAGAFYLNSKFHIPWFVAADFDQYYLVQNQPFHNEALAPFAYRIFTPTIANLFENYGLFYESSSTPFKEFYTKIDENSYRPSALYSFIFVNYVFISISLFFLYKTIESIITDQENPLIKFVSFLLPTLIVLSFSTLIFGFSGIVEGGTLMFVTLLAYFFLSNKLVLFFIFAILSLSQRELIPLILMPLIIFNGSYSNKKKITFFSVAMLVFIIYFIIRKIIPIAGYENQLDINSYFYHFLNFKISKNLLFQWIFSQNILIALILFFLTIKSFLKKLDFFYPFIASSSMLFLLSIGNGVGEVGRILNMCLPFLLIGFAQWLQFQNTLFLKKIKYKTEH
tara:strand:- start:102 stop:1166 length:1065 start_codon:yes stop_codon:yes gene_type:complete